MRFSAILSGLALTSVVIAAPTPRSIKDADIDDANPFDLEERTDLPDPVAEAIVEDVRTYTNNLDLPIKRADAISAPNTDEITELLDSVKGPTTAALPLARREALGLDSAMSTIESAVEKEDLPIIIPATRRALDLSSVTSTVDTVVSTVENVVNTAVDLLTALVPQLESAISSASLSSLGLPDLNSELANLEAEIEAAISDPESALSGVDTSDLINLISNLIDLLDTVNGDLDQLLGLGSGSDLDELTSLVSTVENLSASAQELSSILKSSANLKL